MADGKDPTLVKETLDKDLAKIGRAEAAVQATARSVVAPGLAFLFLAGAFYMGAFYDVKVDVKATARKARRMNCKPSHV